MRLSPLALIPLVAAITLVGCEGRRIVIEDSARSALSVRARLSPSIAALATALNWPTGSVPGATVTAEQLREDPRSPASFITLVTDSQGIAHFSDLPLARYTLRITRELTTDELTRASSVLGDVYALEGLAGATLDDAGAASVDVQLLGVATGALVISEIPARQQLIPGGQIWEFGTYVEIYNNADTAVSLAGKVFFDGFPGWYDIRAGNDCSTFASLMGDPTGIWAQFIYRFPATAKPIGAGQAIVMATDAIDHRQFGPAAGLHDLSRADYEFRGSADADNPLALDMISIGPRDGGFPTGHGWMVWQLRQVIGLSDALDLDTLPTQSNAIWAAGTNFVRIPTRAIIDVVQWKATNERPWPDCAPSVVASIDAGEARLVAWTDSVAGHRKVRATLPSGRRILQKSRNSAADFEVGVGTPGKVP